jgi:hypothetical protein
VSPGQGQQQPGQPAGRGAEQVERAPQPVEADGAAHPGHGRPGRSWRRRVAAGQPHLHGHQPSLDAEGRHQQHIPGVPRRARRDVPEAGQGHRAGSGRQNHQAGQQAGAADLPEHQRDQGSAGPARPVPLEAGQQVEGRRQRLPAEQQHEGVPGRDDHRDRAQGERVERAEPAPRRPVPTARPAREGQRDRRRRPERDHQEQPGQPVGRQRRATQPGRARVPEAQQVAQPQSAAAPGHTARPGHHQAHRPRAAQQVGEDAPAPGRRLHDREDLSV